MITVYNLIHTEIGHITVYTLSNLSVSLDHSISNMCIHVRANKNKKNPISIQLTKEIVDDLDTNYIMPELIAHFFSDTSNMSYKILCKINPAYTDIFNTNENFKKMLDDKNCSYYIGLLHEEIACFDLESTKHLKLNTTPIINHDVSKQSDDVKSFPYPKFKRGDSVFVTHENSIYTGPGTIVDVDISIRYNEHLELYEWAYKVMYDTGGLPRNVVESSISLLLD